MEGNTSSKIEGGSHGETMVSPILSKFEELTEFLAKEKVDQLDLLNQFKSSPSTSYLADECVKSLARVDRFIKNLQHVQLLVSNGKVDEGIDFFLSKSNHCNPITLGNCFFEEEEHYHNTMLCYTKLLWHILVGET